MSNPNQQTLSTPWHYGQWNHEMSVTRKWGYHWINYESWPDIWFVAMLCWMLAQLNQLTMMSRTRKVLKPKLVTVPPPLDPKKQILMFPNVNVKHPTPTTNQRLTQRFNIWVHRIWCRKTWYYLSSCNKTLDKILNWNLHHWLTHKTKINCTTCRRKFTMPSSHRVHQNIHAVHKFNCTLPEIFCVLQWTTSTNEHS